MKVEVNVRRNYVLPVIVALVILIGAIVVWADVNKPNPGHSAVEVGAPADCPNGVKTVGGNFVCGGAGGGGGSVTYCQNKDAVIGSGMGWRGYMWQASDCTNGLPISGCVGSLGRVNSYGGVSTIRVANPGTEIVVSGTTTLTLNKQPVPNGGIDFWALDSNGHAEVAATYICGGAGGGGDGGSTYCELTVKELRDYGCPYGAYLARVVFYDLTAAGHPRDAYCKIFASTNDNSADTATNRIKSCYGTVYRASEADVTTGTCSNVGSNVACSELNDCCPHSGGAYFCQGSPMVWQQKINAQCF